ncbi:MAG: tyrosine-type recombinase/integrase [Planctomycetota bacterium]
MARGCVFQPSYTVKLPDGTRARRQSTTWWIQYRDGQGVKRRRAVSDRKQEAEDALAVAVKDAIAERNGLPVQSAAMLPAGDLAKAYLDAQAPHVCEEHLSGLRSRLNALLTGTRAVAVKDLTPERVEAYLSSLEGELSARTVNTYLQAAKGMLTWAVKRRKLPYNPLEAVSKRSEAEKVRNRRPLSEDEGARLLSAALDGPRRRMARAYKGAMLPLQVQADCARQGRRNALAFRLMLTAGLRLHEVQELRWCDLDLEAGLLFIRGDKGDKLTGRVEDKEIPLPPDTVQALALWKSETRPDEAAAVVDIPDSFVRTLDDDLEAAGIGKRDAAGRVLDNHALRHTYGTWLGKRPDVDPKTVQALMRHKSAALTFGVYIHRDKGRMKAAAEGMPALLPRPFQPESVQAASLRTGTDNAPIDTERNPNLEAGSTRLVQEREGQNAQVQKAQADSEPARPAWKAGALPLCYTRTGLAAGAGAHSVWGPSTGLAFSC